MYEQLPKIIRHYEMLSEMRKNLNRPLEDN